MTPNELRALADALEPMAKAPRFEDFDVPAFCAWVRAQADAQPVAWMYEHDGCVDTPLFTVNRWTKCEEPWNESPLFLHPAPAAPAGWKWVPVEPTPEMLSAVGMMDGYDWHAPGCSPDADHATWYSAPASNREDAAAMVAAGSGEQAEPIDPHMIVAEDRFPDVLAERWKPCPQCGEDVDRECPICDGLGRVLATDSEQTEPKPAPASGDDLGVYKGMADSYRNDAEPQQRLGGSMSINDGGPAFPTAMGEGMTLRDYFAARAMHSILLAAMQVADPESSIDSAAVAAAAYRMSDSMLKAREAA